MQPEQRIVANYELSKRLEELGFPQENSCFYWIQPKSGYWQTFGIEDLVVELDKNLPEEKEVRIEGFKIFIAAPTAEELLPFLPSTINVETLANGRHNEAHFHIIRHAKKYFSIRYFENLYIENPVLSSAGTLANTCAEILIWLAENGHVDFKEKENER